MHIGFEDPSEATGTPEFINAEFRRVRGEIGERFKQLYDEDLKPKMEVKAGEV